jgi:DNA-directed RNA polymerase specialized sigma24 family protein
MREEAFAKAYPLALRSAQVRSAAAVMSGVVLLADRQHLEQEALTRVWLALSQYDPARAGLRTFIEVVVSRQFASMLRARLSRPHFERLDKQQAVADGRFSEMDLRTDVERVLAGLSVGDRRLASLLCEDTPIEASRKLKISRSTVYEGIRRIRIAFVGAGLGPESKLRSQEAAP